MSPEAGSTEPRPGRWASKEPHVSEFGRAMDAMHIDVSTPNGQLFASVRGWYDVHIGIYPGYAERVGDRETAHQLTQLVRLLCVARQRRYHALVEEYLSPPPGPESARSRAFRERQDQTTVTGRSADGAVTFTTTGLSSFDCRLEPGSVDRLGSEGVAKDATEAANLAIWEWLSSIDDLKRRRREEGW